MAFEQCLRVPGSRVLYLAPWSKDAADIVRDITAKLLPDCPDELKPDYNAQNKEYTFPNGSIVRFKGTNGEHAQFLRGGEAHLVMLDECGTMDDLKSVVDDVVTPMVLNTNGTVIMATTPSLTPDHPSHYYYEQCFQDSCGYEFTLREAPHLTDEQKKRALRASGEAAEDLDDILSGKIIPKTTTAQREYFCMWVTDASSAVVPEFDAKAQQEIVVEHRRPPFFDSYTAMDPGMVDRTGILFAYVDARDGKLVIEDEALLAHAGTPEIAKVVRAKELDLWGPDAPVFLRVSDVDLRAIADLSALGLPFTPAYKPNSMGAVWNMRQMVANRTLVIHPRCVNLIRQLRNAVWNKKASDFERLGEDQEKLLGHFDLVAALKYLCRSIVWERNPYPANYGIASWRRSGPDIQVSAPHPAALDTPLTKKLRRRGLA